MGSSLTIESFQELVQGNKRENAGETETSSRYICSGHGLTLTEVPQVVTWNLKKACPSLYSLGLQELSLSLVLLISMAGTVFIWADIIMVPSGWHTEKIRELVINSRKESQIFLLIDQLCNLLINAGELKLQLTENICKVSIVLTFLRATSNLALIFWKDTSCEGGDGRGLLLRHVIHMYKVLLFSLCHLNTNKSQELSQSEDSSLMQHGGRSFLAWINWSLSQR